MKTATKQMIKSALFEATFVVMGVILALAANEWRNDLAQQKATDRALQSIYAELTDNKSRIEESADYHGQLSRQLYSSQSKSDIALFNKGFIFPARVAQSAWLTAMETGALEDAPFETVLNLSELYAAQQRYDNQSITIGNIIYKKLFDGGPQQILNEYKNLATIISTMQFREMELIKLYDSALSPLPNQEKTTEG